MTTLAGRKIRDWREAQTPRITRPAFAKRFKDARRPVTFSTVQGWEEEGKKPDDPRVVNQLAVEGIAAHADWFTLALCPRCERRSDSAEALACAQNGCPLAHLRAA